ncbi:hypothetical protein FHU33_2076 [Blastococcus colisei]|uniref:Transcription factor zinc-finger domain-containing protein n=1 Tax=Blastococcus colisei TaxID=1564162 RepID=A0A543PF24_9ACTN|nr:zf-TFIIB domain-containing protein [Blastococcus colisei]TQN42670.1 hypothetical protein FHU33_2076 [Blastococcus colisei]
MELTCPKCHGSMRTYERNGVHVDQCADCRGIFLDRGELDRLIDAENAWHGGAAGGQAAAQPSHEQSGHERSGHERSGYERSGHPQAASSAGLGGVVGEVLRQVQEAKHSGHQSGYGHKRKKQSFLGDLFG